MWTIELNLDDDFSATCAWHICEEEETISRHFNAALDHRKLDRWVYMGMAPTHEKAHEFCTGLREEMCKRAGKSEINLQESYDKIGEAIIKKRNVYDLYQ